jgi:hypothetical protein
VRDCDGGQRVALCVCEVLLQGAVCGVSGGQACAACQRTACRRSRSPGSPRC